MVHVNRLEGIKAVSFDGDGTLWDFDKVMRHSLRKVLEELERLDPATAGLLTIDGMIETRNRVATDLKGSDTNLETIRLEAFRQTLMEIDRPNEDLARHLNQVYLRHRFEDVELYEDVLPVLDELSPRFSIGLLSNGNSYPDRFGFDKVFSFIVFSQDHHIEKPDPRIFNIALELAGCKKHEMLHVGDSLESDIQGARRARVRSVWLNRRGIEDRGAVPVDLEIHSLRELLEIL